MGKKIFILLSGNPVCGAMPYHKKLPYLFWFFTLVRDEPYIMRIMRRVGNALCSFEIIMTLVCVALRRRWTYVCVLVCRSFRFITES